MTIAVTGHRPDKLNREWNMNGPLSKKIYQELLKKIEHYKPTTLITGMALGVDILFANVAINKKIPFIAAIPCKGQENKWSDSSQKLYRRIINDPLCSPYYVTEGRFKPNCMQLRNIWMCDRADLLIAVWDGSTGGTYNCVNYAVDKGLEIVRIDPNSL